MRMRISGVLLLFLLLLPGLISAQQISVEVFAGTAWSLPLPLLIRQPEHPDLRLRAHYSTRPWEGAPYYAYRFAAGAEPRWEAELVHHKLYLENPPPEIEYLEVSHGYNLATLNHARPTPSGLSVRIGLGVVVGHPEGRVRGRAIGGRKSLLGGGYHIGGLTAQFALSRPVSLGHGFVLIPEGKLTASSARLPLSGGGWARVPNVAVHALAGLGYSH